MERKCPVCNETINPYDLEFTTRMGFKWAHKVCLKSHLQAMTEETRKQLTGAA